LKVRFVFNFGLIHAKFGGVLPLVDDILQNVRCFATKMAGYLNSICNAVDQWWRSQHFGAEPIQMQLW